MHSARHDWRITGAALALLALHATLALWAVSGESVTHDEILHVTGGYFYNRYGDYRLHPENGNLPQRLAAMPAWLLDAPAPPMAGNRYWRTADANVVAHQFFYETGHDHWPMLLAGRTLMLVFSLGTGVLVFGWARTLFGDPASLFALALYAFDPNVLAHAPLATSDSAAVFFLLASSGAFWLHLQTPRWRSGLLSAAVFGLACVAKYSAVLLLPVFVLLLLWRIVCDRPERRTGWLRLAPLTLAGHSAAAVLVIWMFFGFRFSGFAPGLPPADHYILPWTDVLPSLGWQGRVIDWLRGAHVLPEAFLYGYGWVVQSAQARGAFLAGEYSIYGWVKFFPLAFGWKTPLALLAALGLGTLALFRRWRAANCWRRDLTAVAPLVVLFAVYWVFSLASHLNIGHRHILPTYPPLFILVGGLAAPGVLAGWRQRLVPLLLVAGTLLGNARVAPHYMAFFNVLAGGPANGYRLLADSSLDWGQDLPGLADWLARNNAERGSAPVFLSYFGTGEPDYYHLAATKLPFTNGFKLVHPWYELRGGLYCISATMLQQVYAPFRGDWTPEREQEYQRERANEPLFRQYFQDAATREELQRRGLETPFMAKWQRYDQLRFARLCTVLRARRPDASIGYSILIYRLTDEEVANAVARRYSDMLTARRPAD